MPLNDAGGGNSLASSERSISRGARLSVIQSRKGGGLPISPRHSEPWMRGG